MPPTLIFLAAFCNCSPLTVLPCGRGCKAAFWPAFVAYAFRLRFFASLIVGAIGLAALMYGKSVGSVVKMVLGAAMLAYSYLITEGWLLWTSGAVLTLLLLRWKE